MGAVHTARVLPTLTRAVPMKAKLFELGANFFHGRHVEFQPDPFANDFSLAPNLRQFIFQFAEQGQRVGHACVFSIHDYSLSCRPLQLGSRRLNICWLQARTAEGSEQGSGESRSSNQSRTNDGLEESEPPPINIVPLRAWFCEFSSYSLD